MSFGRYLIAFFLPPLHFAIQNRWLAFWVNGALYAMAFPFLLLFGLGFFLWVFAAAHAMWDLASTMREEHMQRQAQLIADKLHTGAPSA